VVIMIKGTGLVAMGRARSAGRKRRLRRGVAVVLGLTLLGLTVAAVLGSLQQAAIVRTTTADSVRTDQYQRAAFLSARLSGLVQGSLHEPDGEERLLIAPVTAELISAVQVLTTDDPKEAPLNRSLAVRLVGMRPMIDRFLSLLDRGDTEHADVVLEQQIEPVAAGVMRSLLSEQARQFVASAANQERARRDSQTLVLGTVLICMLGVAVLGVLGWSTRSHRRLIERMAAHDSLTGLCNRAAFHACAELALDQVRSDGYRPTLLMLDLDGFKDVNDGLGHHIGDLLLVEVAHRLRRAVRGQDTVARLGGDEFAVLLVDAEPEIGEQAADRITQALTAPFLIEGVTLDIEVSIGIATAEPGQDVATVLRHADTAMYTAKEHRLGNARFDPARTHDTAARLTMLGDLRRALDHHGEIVLHYQPKISVDTGEMIGAEALARWQHPTKGLVPPNQFVPILERTSLIHRFTDHVLSLALAQARAWLDAGYRVPVAVNVSTRSLLDLTFPDTVARALAQAGIPGDMLCIEITENTVMADPQRAIAVLRRIRQLGTKTAIDDFGTGYSSMAYLRILPLDEIKIDRSFVTDMATDRSNYVLVESAVDLGHNLGLAVVAEGVEDEPAAAALDRLGCDIAQGYHFDRPLSPADFAQRLAEGRGPRVAEALGARPWRFTTR
jgi:diguanylate cyclase (GGDEF)-like protein